MKTKRHLLIARGKTPVVFELKKQALNQNDVLYICANQSFWDAFDRYDSNSAASFYPMNNFVAVIPFVSKNQFT